MNNKKMLMVFMAFFIGLSGVMISFHKEKESNTAATYEDNIIVSSDSTSVPSSNPDSAGGNEVSVYVCGCVHSPGVYTLEGTSRIAQAVEAAGGMTQDAAPYYLNLAMTVSDGTKIYVPSKEEVDLGQVPVENDNITGESGTGDNAAQGKVNINTADSNQLMTLSGIGQSRADAIIAYRQEHGRFEKIEDIMNVSGIKNSLFDKICEDITV